MSKIMPLNSYGTGPGFLKLMKSNYGHTFTICKHDTSSEVNNHSWMMDIGATMHFTGNKALLTDYTQVATPHYRAGPNASFLIKGYGKAVLRCIGDATRTITIQNIKYSP